MKADVTSAAPAANADGLVRALRMMGRKGMSASLTGDGGTVLHDPRPVAGKPKDIGAHVWALLAAGHWVAKDDDGRWRISARGRDELKRRLSEPGAPKQSPRPRPDRDHVAAPAKPTFNEEESPLSWLKSRRDRDGVPMISDVEFMAGERLRNDFHLAHLEPRVTASWSDAGGGSGSKRSAPGAGVEMQDHVIAAGERVHRALTAVGPELSGILVDVCCHLKGLATAERAKRWPQRSAKIILQLALQALARHYGLDRPRREPLKSTAPIRHWGADGYRPTTNAWIESD